MPVWLRGGPAGHPCPGPQFGRTCHHPHTQKMSSCLKNYLFYSYFFNSIDFDSKSYTNWK
jgi:hypothetical protein